MLAVAGDLDGTTTKLGTETKEEVEPEDHVAMEGVAEEVGIAAVAAIAALIICWSAAHIALRMLTIPVRE